MNTTLSCHHHLALLRSPAVVTRTAAVPHEEYLKEREHILKHKWVLSENAGQDVGFEAALVDWIARHREKWMRAQARRDNASRTCGADAWERDQIDRQIAAHSVAA